MSSHLINYRAISEELTGDREKIRANQVPSKYKGIIKDCNDAVRSILKKAKDK